MQNSVLFGIVMTILNKRVVTRKQLAEKFEMSERTISRYVDVLCAGGIPIYSTFGPNGGYCISDEYKIDKAFFTKEEYQYIISSLNATSSINPKLNTSVLDKFTNLAHRKTLNYIIKNDTLVIDAGSWTNPESFRNRMDTINEAIFSNVTMEITYTDRYDSKTVRLLDPYALALKEGVWYVYGYCHSREDFRLFKLARIRNIKLTDKQFERKESNVYEALKGNFDPDSMVNVEFEFSSFVYDDVHEWLGSEAIIERGAQYVAQATLYNGKTLISKLLSFGSSIRILSPSSLRKELIEENVRQLRQAIRYGDCDQSILKSLKA